MACSRLFAHSNLSFESQYYLIFCFVQVLNFRPSLDWVTLVLDWDRSFNGSLAESNDDPRQFLERIYQENSELVRDFVRQHPTHNLIEVDINDDSSGRIIADAFGFEEACWHHDIDKVEQANATNRSNSWDKVTRRSSLPTAGSAEAKQVADGHNDQTTPGEVLSEETRNKSILKRRNARFLVSLKLPTPVIVLGYPKSGTTSVWNFFNCSGVVSQHYCAKGVTKNHPPCEKGLMVSCVLKNMAQDRPMLEGCGDYQVYAQIDGERPRGPGNRGALLENGQSDLTFTMRHFLPQHFHLDKLHDDFPNATVR